MSSVEIRVEEMRVGAKCGCDEGDTDRSCRGAPSLCVSLQSVVEQTPLAECSPNRLLVWMAHDKHLCQSVVLDLSSPLVIDEYLGGTKRAG